MAVADMTAWLAEDPKNVIVIHCKGGYVSDELGSCCSEYKLRLPHLSAFVRVAGKGRSGTMACSYLISLPKLPSPPQNPRNISVAKHKATNGQDVQTQQSAHPAVTALRAPGVQSPPSFQASTGKVYSPSAWRSKIEAALALHSSQRMKPKSVSAGPLAVSVNTVSSANHPEVQTASAHTGHSDMQRPRSLALGLVPGGTTGGVPSRPFAPGTADSPSDVSGVNGAGVPPSAIATLNTQGEHASLDTASQTPSASFDQSHEEGDEEGSHSGLSVAGRVGVSIASQRRWMGYWARVLAQRDTRASFDQLAPAQSSRSIRILRISILQDPKASANAHGASDSAGGSGGGGGAASAARRFGKLDSFKLFVGRYDTTLVEQLEDFERNARRKARASSHSGNGDSHAKQPTGHPATDQSGDSGRAKPAEPPFRRLAQHGNEEGVGEWGFDVIAEAEKARRFNWPDTPGGGGKGRSFAFFDWFAKLKESQRVAVVAGTGEKAGRDGHTTGAVWHHFGLDPTSRESSSKANLSSLPKAASSNLSLRSSQSQGLLVSPDREICLRVQSRNKVLNALLPDIASSAGWVWLIPAFEEPRTAAEVRSGDRTTVRFPREEVDFAKKITGLRAVEVEWEWIATGDVA